MLGIDTCEGIEIHLWREQEGQTSIHHIDIYSVSWVSEVVVRVGQSVWILVGEFIRGAYASQVPWLVVSDGLI